MSPAGTALREAPGVLTFEEFVAARGPALVRLARGLLRDPDTAEDVVQDVLAKALLSWRRVAGADDPVAYVNRMVVNACTSWWRRAARRERPAGEALPEASGRARPDASTQLADRDQLLTALRALPVKQRTVLVLRYFEDMADEQIADLLDVTTGTVRSNAHRGLATLRGAVQR
ncbi:SigE family RNA polymerase sigma factor [Paenibacillus sp. TRM 82003]|uniref:SigE family RNA polymerase sigma factor n=1 Tax=Kineococcus sp. TRM81007 TaxID=2925831 RepID=UPI001F57715C|nr:SigE family RNA polymerase sigma factor [Kineococcus sp. TRM81007]MCI2240359.1 SigE family RNA polymerase sigma factor [Kineococcus sp. TRM81007]MCI3927464.1 SigE family RNA polymerase sigma factor [Paenibacillus sp. TRM 82003]